jgi:hypothetical protein
MTTQNKAVTCYLPKDIEDFITGYCNEYGITRKDKEGNIYPSLGTGIIELLKLLAYNPELVSSPILDTVPSKFSEDAIKKKIDEILEKKLNSPDTVPSQVTDLEGKVESIILDKLPSIIPEYLPSDLLARIENMERLLRLQQSASIADHSPIPTGEPSPLPPSPPDRPAIASIDGTVTGAIGDITDQSSSPAKKKGLTDSELARHLGIDKSNITRWKQKGEPTQKYRDKWELRGRFWYEKN